MRGKVIRLKSFEEALKCIEKTKEGIFLIGHWSSGLLIKDKEEGVEQSLKEYEGNIPFLFFNKECGIIWNNHFGWCLKVTQDNGDFEVEEKMMYLNTDTGKFPGMKALISKKYTKACVELFKKNGKVYFIKIKELIEGG